MKKLLIFLFIGIFFFSLVSAGLYTEDNVYGTSIDERFGDKPPAFYMPLNTSVFGDFNFNGGWTNNGLSIIDGDIYAQTGYFYNITSLNVTHQDLTILDDLIINGDATISGTIINTDFTTLTDNSIANTLHRHSELVASDGSPDPALSVDAIGRVGIGTTTPQNTLNVVGDGNFTGDIIGQKNINIPLTSSATVGVIEQNNVRFIHTYGTTNLFVGENAGSFGLTGGNNIGIGKNALDGLTDGYENSGIGSYSLSALTEGMRNLGVGFRTGQFMTTADYNVMIGSEAMRYNVEGGYNVAVGRQSMYGVSTNSPIANTAVGTQSLFAITTGTENVAFGYRAGHALTTGDYNVFIGTSTGSTTTTGDTNILIGYDIDASAVGASNELNIGGLIYGDLSTGKVGIGTTSPDYKLQVNGDIVSETTETDSIGASAIRWLKGWFVNLDVSNDLVVGGDLNVTGNYIRGTLTGYTGYCVNTTYTGGIATSCND